MNHANRARCAELVRKVTLFSGPFVFDFNLSPSTGRFSHRRLVVPSEDYSHGRAMWRGLIGEGRETETEQQNKKKTMKMNNQNCQFGLKSRPEQLNKQSNPLPRIDLAKRRLNRSLTTSNFLTLLRFAAPEFFELAEVVGKWVWIRFDCKQPQQVTMRLAELGFHWNNGRQTWQHPCGEFRHARIVNPRRKYGSYFAADMLFA